jgi:hypothetical protein
MLNRSYSRQSYRMVSMEATKSSSFFLANIVASPSPHAIEPREVLVVVDVGHSEAAATWAGVYVITVIPTRVSFLYFLPCLLNTVTKREIQRLAHTG